MTAIRHDFDSSTRIAAPRGQTITIGDIAIDVLRYRAWRADRAIKLGTREFHLLSLLMRQPGRVFSRSQILDQVWGADAAVTDRNVDAYVKRLRRMLSPGGLADPIRTVRSVGYAFDEFYQN